MNKDALIEKLRKLKAIAEDKSVSEAEAALYAQKVAQLLAEHNLTESAINIETHEDAPVGEDTLRNAKTGDPWAQQLCQVLANLYFCDIYLMRHNQKTEVRFVGKPHNVEVAKSMAIYLIKTIGSLANEYARSPEAILTFDYSFTKARNGFERGCANRLYWRVHQMWKDQTKPTPVRSASGNPANLPALYQDEVKLVELYKAKLGLRRGSGRGSDTSGNHAANGRRAADGISLNAQVGGSGTRMLK